jgi:23S rRNA-/tRNA-specific pseudouridylate synthase
MMRAQARAAEEQSVRVLAERDGVMLVYKPAGWAAEPTPHDEQCVVRALSLLRDGRRIHAASRLDVGVSGVMVCTLGADAARRIVALRAAGRLHHCYAGICRGRLVGAGSWSWSLGRSRDLARRALARNDAAHARPAITHYAAVATTGEATLGCFRPQTGRMHQIRAHAARAGLPLWGDRRYGGPGSVTAASGRVHSIGRIALHCMCVEIEGLLGAEAPVPDDLRLLWRLLGGEGNEDAWALAARVGRDAGLVP